MKRALLLLLAWRAVGMEMDSARGSRLFHTQGCIQCHSIQGEGGHSAPDLGRVVDRAYTPASLASTLWNHAPAMWSAIRSAGEAPAALSEQDAADLFAFFYEQRFFELPGDAGRGKRVFAERRCAGCHGVGPAANSGGLPPSEWSGVDDPVALAAAMWNHAPRMSAEIARGSKKWPQLSSQDLSDLLVFVRNVPRAHAVKSGGQFRLAASGEGEAVFASKGCAACHGPGTMPLADRLRGRTLTGIAAEMWNHAPLMRAPASPQTVHLEAEEMRALLDFLWASPFFEERGSVTAGRRSFASKRCASCHDDPATGAPRIGPRLNPGAGTFNGIVMVAALWKHGPKMLDSMNARGLAWQRFKAEEMSNLIAYLNSGERK